MKQQKNFINSSFVYKRAKTIKYEIISNRVANVADDLTLGIRATITIDYPNSVIPYRRFSKNIRKMLD